MSKPTKKTTLADVKATVDTLLLATKAGFDSSTKQHDGLVQQFNGLVREIKDVKEGQTRLERGQEDILLKLDNKTNKIDHDALGKRVNNIEKRVGIKHSKSI